jgi:hypothetical protein
MSYQTVGFWEEEKARSWRGQGCLLVTDREQSRADSIRQKGWDLFRFLIGNGCGEVTREVEDMAVYILATQTMAVANRRSWYMLYDLQAQEYETATAQFWYASQPQ